MTQAKFDFKTYIGHYVSQQVSCTTEVLVLIPQHISVTDICCDTSSDVHLNQLGNRKQIRQYHFAQIANVLLSYSKLLEKKSAKVQQNNSLTAVWAIEAFQLL